MARQDCFLCDSCDTKQCDQCGDVAGCEDHLKYHKLGYSGGCSPYRVVEIEGAGRGLVATRDIARGEHIMTTMAAGTGPCARTAPQCVNCFLLLSSAQFCPRCNLLVCSAGCSNGSAHQVECSILTTIRVKVKRMKDGERIWRESLSNITASVTTIRLLSLKWRDPAAWSILTNLMNHQVNENVWRLLQDAFHTVLHLDPRITVDDLRHVFGIQSTNGAILHFPPGFGRGVGVFPIQALINHSCMCNTLTQEFLGEHKVEIKARFSIAAGSELTTSYIQPTQATVARRQFLFHTWNFWCCCPRCRDPAEGGANLSGLTCSPSCPGVVLPLSPLDCDSDWVCSECGQARTDMQAQQVMQQTLMEINSFSKENIKAEELEEIICRLEKLLCNTHYVLMEIQQKLMMVYMQMKVVDRPAKDRKIQLCHNILQYMDKIDPDNENSQKRQRVRSCLVEAKLEVLTQDYRMGIVNKNRLAKALGEKQELMCTGSRQNK
eukprot:GFUD01004063.1.p1 GENE.GFUD01004063.1~~GFUD01004063.1.p1  ORF type:complete len:492 (+),score=147.83 GFUD01004063.1:26-1501(+)